MAQQILLGQGEFFGILAGWVFAVIFGLFFLAFMKITPARTFLKAWLTKNVVCWVKHRTGLGEFKLAKMEDLGSLTVEDVGFVQMVEGSQVMEKKSKVPIFDVFSDYGVSIPKEYAPVIQELREAGFKIDNFADYKELIKLASDSAYEKEFIENVPEEEKEKAKERIKTLKEMKIQIRPFKTYSVHDLAFMFPNNISPIYVDAKVQNAVTREIKKKALQKELLLYGGISVLIVVMSLIIFLKVYKGDQCDPQIIIRTVETGVQAVQQNLTM